ncbi:MAG: hypothetical protein ABSE62_04870 [Chthoniobacteraceae bacterium]|jgi:hypothetical protein
MTDRDIENHNLLMAVRVMSICSTLDPAVLDRIAANLSEFWEENRAMIRRIAVLSRIARGESCIADDAGVVPEFIGKVANFMQIFESAENVSPFVGSKVYEDLKTSLNEVRHLYRGALQTSVKPEADASAGPS